MKITLISLDLVLYNTNQKLCNQANYFEEGSLVAKFLNYIVYIINIINIESFHWQIKTTYNIRIKHYRLLLNINISE